MDTNRLQDFAQSDEEWDEAQERIKKLLQNITLDQLNDVCVKHQELSDEIHNLLIEWCTKHCAHIDPVTASLLFLAQAAVSYAGARAAWDFVKGISEEDN